jgi:hypothetical protein
MASDALPPQIDGVILKWGMTASQCIENGLGLMANYTTKEPQLEFIDAKCPHRVMRDQKETRKISSQTVNNVLLFFFNNGLESVSTSFSGENILKYYYSGLESKYGESKTLYKRNLYNAIIEAKSIWAVGKTTIELDFNYLKKKGYLNYSFISQESQKALKECRGKGEGL